MSHKRESGWDHTGLNLIRIVIGSYFMAVSLGLIAGIDPGTVLRIALPHALAVQIGAVVLLVLSILFMSGLFLRQAALGLSLFILTSGGVCLLNGTIPQSLSLFWRDLVMVAAVLLSYGSLRRHELRKASLIHFRGTRALSGRVIAPRRVTVAPDCAGEIRRLRPDQPALPHPETLAALAEMGREMDARATRPTPQLKELDDDEVENLFLGI